DFGARSVHFGCASEMMCSLSRNGLKVNIKMGAFAVHALRYFGYTQNGTLERCHVILLALSVGGRLSRSGFVLSGTHIRSFGPSGPLWPERIQSGQFWDQSRSANCSRSATVATSP